ncbi:DUF456 domain-containing protein [Haloferula rosea]|uniref:DUF456 domain-containing protein n=1 Tax=Haloferula rosea TaxID=490093 RepID=A0A934RHE4_9BACT|nr:DUF456 domain-containing protein [Haloferula rosea]MBK1828375.1 DUF456 domain-containing protein [Haloferula rosea]
MWEAIGGWGGWDELGATGTWVVTACFLLIGLAGCFIPVIPGHLVILLGAVFHRLVYPGNSGVEWWTFTVLALLLIASQVFEFVSGAAGSRWFGGTKWGAGGAFVGGIVGMFFMPFGLLLGPLIGAYAFEAWFAKQETKPAVVSGVGSAVGTLASLVVKVIVGVAMIVWLLVDILFIG